MTRLRPEELEKLLKDNPDLQVDEGRRTVAPPPEAPVTVENFEFAPVRKHKYGAQRTAVDGIVFDSKREATHYQTLLEMQRAGLIQDLELQPVFVLQEAFTDRKGKKHRPILYKADFRCTEVSTGATLVIDTKGMETPVFKLKAKLLLYKYPQLDFQIWK